MTVNKLSYPDGDIAVVEIYPSDLPPVRYKGRIYVRVGPHKAIANEQEERILTERRVALAHSFDASPCKEAKLDDISLGQFEAYRRQAIGHEIISENHRFRYGVERAKALLEQNGNPTAQFEFDEHSVLVKVFRSNRQL